MSLVGIIGKAKQNSVVRLDGVLINCSRTGSGNNQSTTKWYISKVCSVSVCVCVCGSLLSLMIIIRSHLRLRIIVVVHFAIHEHLVVFVYL